MKWFLVLLVPVVAGGLYFVFFGGVGSEDALDEAYQELLQAEEASGIETSEKERLVRECIEGNRNQEEFAEEDVVAFLETYCDCIVERLSKSPLFKRLQDSGEIPGIEYFGPEIDGYFQTETGGLANSFCYEEASLKL